VSIGSRNGAVQVRLSRYMRTSLAARSSEGETRGAIHGRGEEEGVFESASRFVICLEVLQFLGGQPLPSAVGRLTGHNVSCWENSKPSGAAAADRSVRATLKVGIETCLREVGLSLLTSWFLPLRIGNPYNLPRWPTAIRVHSPSPLRMIPRPSCIQVSEEAYQNRKGPPTDS